jgi:FMN phosphatase YigB (HAD superfamily)
MSLTLLLDLDDTLLNNDIDTFLPAYLKALSKHLAPLFPGDVLIRELLAATRLMVENRDPAFTLEEVFSRAFYPALGTTQAALKDEIDTFYSQVFPTLQTLTAVKPEAVRLVEEALARGYQVVIATNPLFPRVAIEHRLAWAGLPVHKYPFALITSFEKFHFTKPHPTYYAEILAQLGWPDQPGLMVGNSLSDDIKPAAVLGLPTFWIKNESESKTESDDLSSQGSLSGVLPWAERLLKKGNFQPTNAPKALAASLRSTPAALDTMTRNLSSASWNFHPAPGSWSLTQILCHLRDVDTDVNWTRIEKLCEFENPFLPGIDTDLWAEERDYEHQNGPTALQEFIRARNKLILLLSSLPDAAWEKTARHAIFGPTRMVELVSFIATHDRNHIQQVLSNLRAGENDTLRKNRSQGPQ